MGSIIKAVGIALIKGESLAQNIDKFARRCWRSRKPRRGDRLPIDRYGGYGYWFPVEGCGEYQRGDSISQNLDNITLAVLTAVAAVMPAYWLSAYSFYALAFAGLVKAIGSNGLRNIVSLATSAPAPTPTATP